MAIVLEALLRMIKPFVRTVYLPKLCLKLCPVPRGQIEQREWIAVTALRRPDDIAGVERRGISTQMNSNAISQSFSTGPAEGQ